jgi:hypothetical protein
VRFRYTNDWSAEIAPGESPELAVYSVAEGRCEGRIVGRLLGANHPRRRSDRTFLPNFQGVIETDDGAAVLFDYRGFGRAHPPGRRQIMVTATHLSGDPRYRWLNDSVGVGAGEVRAREGGSPDLVIDRYEAIWEPIPE